jgi:hypothetical protein
MTTKDQRSSVVVFIAVMAIAVVGAAGYDLITTTTAAFRGDWSVASLIFNVVLPTLFLFIAWRAWFKRTPVSIRWLCGIAAFLLAMAIPDLANWVYTKAIGASLFVAANQRSTPLLDPMVFFVAVIAAVIFYRVSVSRILTRLGLDLDCTAKQRLWSIKTSLIIIAFCTFGFANDIIKQLPNRPRISPAGPGWGDLVEFSPLIVAVAFYKLGVFIASRRVAAMRDLAQPTTL